MNKADTGHTQFRECFVNAWGSDSASCLPTEAKPGAFRYQQGNDL